MPAVASGCRVARAQRRLRLPIGFGVVPVIEQGTSRLMRARRDLLFFVEMRSALRPRIRFHAVFGSHGGNRVGVGNGNSGASEA